MNSNTPRLCDFSCHLKVNEFIRRTAAALAHVKRLVRRHDTCSGTLLRAADAYFAWLEKPTSRDMVKILENHPSYGILSVQCASWATTVASPVSSINVAFRWRTAFHSYSSCQDTQILRCETVRSMLSHFLGYLWYKRVHKLDLLLWSSRY